MLVGKITFLYNSISEIIQGDDSIGMDYKERYFRKA